MGSPETCGSGKHPLERVSGYLQRALIYSIYNSGIFTITLISVVLDTTDSTLVLTILSVYTSLLPTRLRVDDCFDNTSASQHLASVETAFH